MGVTEIVIVIPRTDRLLERNYISGVIKKIDEEVKETKYHPHVKVVFK